MPIPDMHALALGEHILPELPVTQQRLVLWKHGQREGDCEHWERIGNTATDVNEERGLYSLAAVATPVSHQVGFWGRLLKYRRRADTRVWILPDADPPECGACPIGWNWSAATMRAPG